MAGCVCAGSISVACGYGAVTQSAEGGTVHCYGGTYYDQAWASISPTVAEAHAAGEWPPRPWATASSSRDVVVTIFGGTGHVLAGPCFEASAYYFRAPGGLAYGAMGNALGYTQVTAGTSNVYNFQCATTLDFVFGEPQTFTFSLFASADQRWEPGGRDAYVKFYGFARGDRGLFRDFVRYSMVDAVDVPEPATAWFLVIAAGLGFAGYRRRT